METCASCFARLFPHTTQACSRCRNDNVEQSHCKPCLVPIAPAQGYCHSCHQSIHPDMQNWTLRQHLIARRRHRRSSSSGAVPRVSELAAPFRASGAGPPEEWKTYLKDSDLESYPHVFLQVANECTGSQLVESEVHPSVSLCGLIRKADPELSYELLKPMVFGESGGVVYSARKLSSGALYAAKVLKQTSSRQRQLAQREVQMLQSAAHSCVVELVESFEYHK